MHQPLLHKVHHQHLWLTPHKYIYWQEAEALIVADLHVGKTGHFRKHGIAVTPNVFKEDLQTLLSGITYFKAKQVIAVGDLFHSYTNNEHAIFTRWLAETAVEQFHLVKGNHDILSPTWYAQNNIILHPHELVHPPFAFIHDAKDITKASAAPYYFTGHLHPGVPIKMGSKQNLRLPCYWFGNSYAVLPAFSKFTGLANIKAAKTDTIFAITPTAVIKL